MAAMVSSSGTSPEAMLPKPRQYDMVYDYQHLMPFNASSITNDETFAHVEHFHGFFC
jgi:hypothetical protein